MFKGEHYHQPTIEYLAEKAVLQGKNWFIYVDDGWNEWEMYVYDVFDEEEIQEIKERADEKANEEIKETR